MCKGAVNEEDGQTFRFRKAANLAFNFLANMAFRKTGAYVTDSINGFRAIRADLAKTLQLDAAGYTIEYQMTMRALAIGARIREFPTHEYPRIAGETGAPSFQTGLRFLGCFFKELAQRLIRVGLSLERRALIRPAGGEIMPRHSWPFAGLELQISGRNIDEISFCTGLGRAAAAGRLRHGTRSNRPKATANGAESHAADARTRADAAQARADTAQSRADAAQARADLANTAGANALALAQTDAQRADILEAQMKVVSAKVSYLQRNVVYKKIKHKKVKHKVVHHTCAATGRSAAEHPGT